HSKHSTPIHTHTHTQHHHTHKLILPSKDILCPCHTHSYTHTQIIIRSSVPTCPPSKTCTPPESGNGQEKSLQTPHTPDTNYSNSSPLVDAHCLLDKDS